MRSYLLFAAALLVCLSVPAFAGEDPSDDLQALRGDWKRVSQQSNGEDEVVESGENLRVRIREDKLTLWRDDERVGDLEIRLKLTPTTNPKLIDLVLPDGGVLEGIYRLEGKRWHLCIIADPNVRERPDGFATKTGDKRVLVVLEKLQ